MLEDQVAYLLQRYLGNYVKGLSKEALKISVWQGDVELTNMQLKPEALNSLKLPVKVKAGFLGSVKLKVPWSRLGQDPVLVHLDSIFLLAEPATQVEGSTEDAIQDAKRTRIREMELKLLETRQKLNSELNKSWLGSLINTVIGNLKLSISNIHIRYEDLESNPGHPFAVGVTLDKLSAITVDDNGKETFATGGALEQIQKSAELERLAIYWDSDSKPWYVEKPWENLLPFEWAQVFKLGTKDGKPAANDNPKHSYILQPVSGNASYLKDRPNMSGSSSQPVQRVTVNLDDVTLGLSKNGYGDLLKLADNFTAFNQRLKYAHYRPLLPVKTDPNSWWRYAYRAVSDQVKKGSGKLSWEQVLRNARLRKKYISLYAGLLKSDLDRAVVDENEDIEDLDRELDIEVILQWRMLAHKFVEQSVGSELYKNKQKAKKSWWSFGWTSQPEADDNEPGFLTDEDWERLNNIIGFKESDDKQSVILDSGDSPHILLNLHMKHNASKLIDFQECLADLSCDNLDCCVKLYSEAKVFDIKLGSYRLLSPNGLLAESESASDSLVGVFSYKPLDADVDWSMVAKASPCYVTYLKDSIDQIINFFQNNNAVSQTLAQETASVVQMTFDEVKRTAARQVNRALKERTRFSLDLDIAAPKITIPTEFYPDNVHPTKLLLDLGKLMIRSQDNAEFASPNEMNIYSQFDLVLRDVSAFLVDGDYHWSHASLDRNGLVSNHNFISFLPVVDKCGVFLKFQQIRSPVPTLPSTRLSVRLPSMGFHFSPARYHRLMEVAKIFQGEDANGSDVVRPWDQADLEGWLYHLTWKGVGGREAVWQRRFFCLVGPFLYELESPDSRSYKNYFSLRGKHILQIPAESVGKVEHVLAVCDAGRSSLKVVEDPNVLVLRCESENSRRTWQGNFQGAIYRVSGTAPIAGLMETSSDSEDSELGSNDLADLSRMERLFFTGVLDELKISFSYSSQGDQSFMKLLLAEERRLLEFRAICGQIEVSIRANDVFIGTVLKALEIEDLVCSKGTSQTCYLTRSFIRNEETPFPLGNTQIVTHSSNDLSKYDGDDEFFEASESLTDSVSSTLSTGDGLELMSSGITSQSPSSSLKTPSFDRIAGLLPDDTHLDAGQMGVTDALDGFVKSQIIIFDQNSTLYANVDKQVVVTLSTLSFFCRRPTVLAILEFVNAINANDDSCESFSDSSSTATRPRDTSRDMVSASSPHPSVPEPIIKSLLGKGKSRVIFDLVLNMTRAEIVLMKENGSKLATLSQNNFLTNIKVFPSSFSIKASLGNLRISDDNLHSSHMYFWACDMRNPGGSSFVELVFCSFSGEDEDYEGYDYSLFGQLSEVRIVYLNRFLQEVVTYFMGLVPNNSKDFIKVNDQAENSEKWFTKGEIEGSPALKLDLSLKKPIILMPQRTNSKDYLKLDVVQIAVQNTFKWIGGGVNEVKALHVDILKVLFEDINLNVGSGSELGESIIQDVKGVSIVIQRTLRDLLHQIPSIEVSIKIEALKAALSNKEYEIIMECALANMSETPNIDPPIKDEAFSHSADVLERSGTLGSNPAKAEDENREKSWVATKISVDINLVELSIHYGITREAPLATLKVSGVWLLYKSNSVGAGFFSATLKDLTVVDDREGTEQERRLAIGKPDVIGYSPSESLSGSLNSNTVETTSLLDSTRKFVPAMLILDARFCEKSTYVFLCIQRPQLLVALDFLLAIVEFFVPTVRGSLSHEEDPNSSQFVDALILDNPTFCQPCAEFTIAPHKPLILDDERFDLFTYDGRGGILYLKDRQGLNLSGPSMEALVYVGNGKKLQFTNVTIKNGLYLDSCVQLGSNSSYSANENDNVTLEEENGKLSLDPSGKSATTAASQNNVSGSSMELIFELQAISPELTFYNTARNTDSLSLSNKLLHAKLDAFSRVVLKGNTVQMSADVLGLTMESNGITILEPFDTSVKFSNASGKTSIQLGVSNVFMNFSFSILRLFLAVEEDILSFLRTTSKKSTVLCSEFDRVGTIKNPIGDQVNAFWRPRAPTGFAILGDYLTPIDIPPSKGVIAVNTSLVRVKRPKSFTLLWPPSSSDGIPLAEGEDTIQLASDKGSSLGETFCSIWLPEPPKGYVAMGCVASPGMAQPPISSVFCVLASLVTPCGLRDCISIGLGSRYPECAFWRVDNAFGTFLPAGPSRLSLSQRAYELRYIYFGLGEISHEKLKISENQASTSVDSDTIQSERSSTINSRRRFEAVATFQLIWWNQGSGSRKHLSIWRPLIPEGMVYFGDIAVQGFEPPNTCVVLQDSDDYDLYKAPLDFQLVQHIKKQRRTDSLSFWMPQAPPGFVSLGCVAFKGIPKQSDFSSLRCIRSDMVSADQFSEESIWDNLDFKFAKEQFSIWTVANELGTFIVRNGLKKPPKRFAFKLVDPDVPSGSDEMVVDAEIRTFSAALFDDYGGLMVPLFNISLSGIGLSLHGRQDSLNSSVVFSLAARSYNDKYESWEPLVEPVDGSLRYHYNPNSPGIASQLRLTSSRDMNLNVSVSSTNMILQAYASWNNLSHAQESRGPQEANFPAGNSRHMTTVHEKANYYIIPQNRLGKDIFIKAPDVREFPGIIKMPAGDKKVVQVPVPKNMLDSHLKGTLLQQLQVMVTIIVAEAELPKAQCVSSCQYSVSIRLYKDQSSSSQSYLNQQCARTCGTCCNGSESADVEFLMWNEVFFFKIDSAECWMVEFILNETGKGDLVGRCLSSLKQLTGSQNKFDPHNYLDQFKWVELCPGESELDVSSRKSGRIKCAVFFPLRSESDNIQKSVNEYRKSGSVQISPAREGPWTTVQLNYGAPAACWQLGSDVVASEVSVLDGNRYITIRSLVSVQNSTDITLDLCLKLKASNGNAKQIFDERNQYPCDENEFATDEFFESEKFNPGIGWVPCHDYEEGVAGVELPSGWEWLDEWFVDKSSVNTSDGWVYAPYFENLRWPQSCNPLKCVNYARQRRWTRNRKRLFEHFKSEIVLGPLKPGEALPLPLPCLAPTALYILQLRPSETTNKYLWSSVMDMSTPPGDLDSSKEISEICVTNLTEFEKLLYCSEISESSSWGLRGMWFSLRTQAAEIMKDIHFNPIHDWAIVIKSPVSVANYLPFMSEISLLEMQTNGHFLSSFRGVFSPGETIKVYNSDIRNPLYFSLLPQRGWLPLHEAILISQSSHSSSKTMNFRSSVSGRIVQILIEHNHSEERPLMPKIIKVYSPYWIKIARCPPLSFRLIDSSFKRSKKFQLPFQTKRTKEVILEEITDEEMSDGYTIASAINFKTLGLSASISNSGIEQFGTVKDLSPLGDMDGSLELLAYNADGNCMQLFVSLKPCPYQSVPTKVISVRPFMTFTNRVGQNILLKFSSGDEPKILRAYDTRVSFVHQKMDGPNEIQVRLDDTEWSFPLQILKEDTVTVALKKYDGKRSFLRTEIRGYEEGSQFIVVFRLGSAKGPIRIENRAKNCTISFRQTGFGDDAWIQLQPFSTTIFSWEDPYGQKVIDAKVHSASDTVICKCDLNKLGLSSLDDNSGLYIYVKNTSDVKVVSFVVESMLVRRSADGGSLRLGDNSRIHPKLPEERSPLELIIEMGVVGISVVDHKPREVAYLYMERVFISYSTGYDGGSTSRFKLILGYLQLDNQLPLTVMPVLLAPEQIPDMHHPVFKMTITIRNENLDGLQIYPYFYIRVTDKCWRVNVHEPIIWALIDFFNSLQLDRIPQNSSVSQVDPEIRVDLIDISEVRLKVSLETAPAQRPHGLLGVWGPVLSAVGNAFKIQLHLRKVMHRDRFLRKSAVISVIGNRIWRDLIHNPLHLIFSVDVLGVTSSTLSSLSKGFAELSTDGQFLKLRSKQVWSRRITGVGDGIVQGTEALAQGVAFGVSGVVRKPVESARQSGLLGLAHGIGQAFLGFFVQPVSGALDFVSLTVDGISASCTRCLEILNNKKSLQRFRTPRAFHVDNILREYSEREAVGQMVLYLAEASRSFGCTEIFKEPSKFAWSDCYADHFVVPYQRIVLVTNRRVMLLQCADPDRMEKKPCKIMWDVPWENILALELAKAGYQRPSHLIVHLKSFSRAENFVRVIKCNRDETSERDPQAVQICSIVRKMLKANQNDALRIMVPSSQKHESSAWKEVEGKDPQKRNKGIITSTELSSSPVSSEWRFVKHCIIFTKVWSSEQESKGRCTLCQKQSSGSREICSVWRPVCPEGYIAIGDIARLGSHPPNVAAVYCFSDQLFALPVGYDLVWRNCLDDYKSPVSIWHPRAPEGYVSLGCVVVPDFTEPELDLVYCISEQFVEETTFEEQKVWSAPDSYPWACHIYQSCSDALPFVALRQPREESDWKPRRVVDNPVPTRPEASDAQ